LPQTRLPRPQTPRLPSTRDVVGEVDAIGVQTLSAARSLRLEALVRDNPTVLDLDDQGAAVVRGQVLAVAPSPEALQALLGAGFKLRSRTELGDLGLGLAVLEAPPGVPARDALRQARALDPGGQYDVNHIYSDAGAGAEAQPPTGRSTSTALSNLRIGLIDSGVDARSPALRAARIEQRGFADGGIQPRGHGLATASLLAGAQGRFRGAAPGATLYVADVYGSTPAGGSAAVLSAALAWMALNRVPVINVSLVGPPNLTVQAVVRALVARGHLIVAAVGNDGPAAPPLYPAAYPGVIAVTAVDARRRLLPEAGRPPKVDFAGPGADMAAPAAGGGFVAVRGTSFAAPLVAASLARHLPTPDPSATAGAVQALARDAIDLGPRGPDRTYGRGLVGIDLATRPGVVAARGVLASQ
jgi:subtilisin family serine protease